jgi:glycosyltransferase involved in cell wall biosynthesis
VARPIKLLDFHNKPASETPRRVGWSRGTPNAELEWIATKAARFSRVTVCPAVPPEAVRAMMSDYDMIAIPSRSLEAGPLVALEAFPAGTPVLGADLGGIAELVRNRIDGILVPPNDATAWARAILEISTSGVLLL